MADLYSIIDDQVVPYSGGRMHTDTNSWRDATDLELEQQGIIKELEDEIERLENKLLGLSMQVDMYESE